MGGRRQHSPVIRKGIMRHGRRIEPMNDRPARFRWKLGVLLALVVFAGNPRASEPSLWDQDPMSDSVQPENDAALARLQATVEELRTEVERLKRTGDRTEGLPVRCGCGKLHCECDQPAYQLQSESDDLPWMTHTAVYDDAWILRPMDPKQTPFELAVSLHNQFRHTAFQSEQPTTVNAAGQVVRTPDRNDFDINRGRLVFSGFALDPRLEFYVNLDFNTVSDQQIQMLMSWIRFRLDPSINLSYGLSKVPGTWEWLESSRYTLGADRSLATTFFRPSMTAGVWADGILPSRMRYRFLIGDGFNTFSLKASEVDTNLVYSGMAWWESQEEFGRGFADFEWSDDFRWRAGHALTHSRQDADPAGQPGPEQTVIRLSDGTRLVEPGALAPGVTVNRFDLTLYALHAGWKWRGLSGTGEYFFRWLTDIEGNGAIPRETIFDQGAFAQVGQFLVPQSLELFGRYSTVRGPFGDASEWAAGVNWYVHDRRNWRATFDVAWIDDSATQQDRTGYLAGASGALFRTQVWTFF